MSLPLRLFAVFIALVLALPAAAEKRVALVLGNAAYKEAPLKNPVNDARAMAAKLKLLGFSVILRENATKLEMERAVADFGDQLNTDTIGLFFYAGHGMQVDGRNFLVPTDARIETQSRVRLETLDVDLVLDQMATAGSRVNLVLLDACRNNPFERRFRATGGGLAQINAPQGTLISYATAPGKVAADGAGENGLYTSELLRALDAPGLQVEEVFKRVRIEVARASSGAQTPWEASSLTGSFFFKDAAPVAAPAPAPVPAPVPAPAAAPQPDRELMFWTAVQGSSDPAMFEAYLQQFPSGTFAPLARAKADALRRQATPPPAAAIAPPPAPVAAAPAPSPKPAPAAPAQSFAPPLAPPPPPVVLTPPAPSPAPKHDALAAALPLPAAAAPVTLAPAGRDLTAVYASAKRTAIYDVKGSCGLSYRLRSDEAIDFRPQPAWIKRFTGDDMIGSVRIEKMGSGLQVSVNARTQGGGGPGAQPDSFGFTFIVPHDDIRPDGTFTVKNAENLSKTSRCGKYSIEFVVR